MKHLKKGISMFLVLLLCAVPLFGLSGCGGNRVDIAFCMSQSNELNEAILTVLQEEFSDLTVRSENANSNSTTQVDQVNNFITMGVKMIVVSPVSLEALKTPLEEARKAGIKVVVSGATSQGVDCYDAVTMSDEYLLGSYIAVLGKNWAEANMQGKSFDTVICYNNDFESNIDRSNGIKSITNPKLTDKTGAYLDANGNVVASAEQAADNPAYCAMISENGNHVYEFAMTPNQSISEYMPTILGMYPNAKLFLLYGSLAAPTMSNTIVSNPTYNTNLSEYAIFGGGVSGTQEPACILGSLESGVGQTFIQSGDTVTGIESIFRGAVSFGGADAAKSVVDLCSRVYNGVEGTDYVKENIEPLGVWYTVATDGTLADTLACMSVSQPLGSAVQAFDPIQALSDPNTEIKWENK